MKTELTFKAEPFELSPGTACGSECPCSKCQTQTGLVSEDFEDPELGSEGETKALAKATGHGRAQSPSKVFAPARAGAVKTVGAQPMAGRGPLFSLRFRDDPELIAVAQGRLRLGRVTDSPYPAPIRSAGRGVRMVQQALIELGYSLPLYGDDGRYSEETYQAVLAYKRKFNIRTESGYLDGIVGQKTITHLDAKFPPGPLPACPYPAPPVVAAAFAGKQNVPFGIPWMTCNPQLEPGPFSMCDRRLPDQGERSSENGGGISVPALGNFYCNNKPRLHLEFSARWEEMLPPDQRPSNQRNRAATAPRYDISFSPSGYREENLIPGRTYSREITTAAPRILAIHFITLLQRNRIFHVRYAIQERD
jgi:hypothetical protein